MNKTGLLFPHQLFENNELISSCKTVYLIEEYLFFNQYKFHKQKITFHRASMKFYEDYLVSKGIEVHYIESHNELSDTRKLISYIHSQGINTIEYIDTTDNWLEKRINETANKLNLSLNKYDSPLFINSPEEIEEYFSDKKRMFQTDFYKSQRIKRNILLDENQKPIGGKWTFDDENRLKYPKTKVPPKISFDKLNTYYQEAKQYTEKYFPNNYGTLENDIVYPSNFEESKQWLQTFFENRFHDFGAYEDAIVTKESFLHHSVLTPMLNVGLITPQFIIDEAIKYSIKKDIPINSVEGFVRQIIGWREFIRAVYQLKGTEERTKNYWKFTRKIPPSFWNGTTGIKPIDDTIRKVLETGYCHHIERLMVLGNFMLLCEFDPNEVYRWFMEMFIDSYDWVMVPNVYGMSQFADGGIMATKPYISGSNYLFKMSDYEKGSWQATWDGLFWRFMHTHRDFFLQNPRLGMLVKTFDKMPDEKKEVHLSHAEKYLESLSNG